MITTAIATPETDAANRKRFNREGAKAAADGLPRTACPHDPTSMVAGWWIEGYNSVRVSRRPPLAEVEQQYDAAYRDWQAVSVALIGREHGTSAELLAAIAALKSGAEQ